MYEVNHLLAKLVNQCHLFFSYESVIKLQIQIERSEEWVLNMKFSYGGKDLNIWTFLLDVLSGHCKLFKIDNSALKLEGILGWIFFLNSLNYNVGKYNFQNLPAVIREENMSCACQKISSWEVTSLISVSPTLQTETKGKYQNSPAMWRVSCDVPGQVTSH